MAAICQPDWQTISMHLHTYPFNTPTGHGRTCPEIATTGKLWPPSRPEHSRVYRLNWPQSVQGTLVVGTACSWQTLNQPDDHTLPSRQGKTTPFHYGLPAWIQQGMHACCLIQRHRAAHYSLRQIFFHACWKSERWRSPHPKRSWDGWAAFVSFHRDRVGPTPFHYGLLQQVLQACCLIQSLTMMRIIRFARSSFTNVDDVSFLLSHHKRVWDGLGWLSCLCPLHNVTMSSSWCHSFFVHD